MPITVWAYLKEYEAEKADILDAVTTVLESGKLILGKSVEGFENEFSSYCGLGHGIGVNSGTDALFLGLKALGVGPDDEVITVANTAVPTVCAISSTGAKPVFVDIDPATYLMDVSQLPSRISPKTKCILPVHLYGQCVDMTAVGAIAEQHGLSVLEDCAQSHGAMQGGRMAGAMSDLSAFSFYPTKLLGGYGDAGMICTDSETLAAKCRRLRFYGMENQYYSIEHGYNSRLDEIHAEILRRKLSRLDGYLKRRRQLAKQYDELLADTALTLPAVGKNNEHAYYVYVCRHPLRDKIIEELKARDIFVNISYPWPIHTMTGYAHLGGKEGDLPETEQAAKEIFSLPMYPTLTDDEQGTVSDALHDILLQL